MLSQQRIFFDLLRFSIGVTETVPDSLKEADWAEQYALAHDAELRFSRMVFRGGHEDFERGMAFFLPDYMEETELIESEHIRAIKLTAAFGEPAHRDYMGAVLGMGGGIYLMTCARQGAGAAPVCGAVLVVDSLLSMLTDLLMVKIPSERSQER